MIWTRSVSLWMVDRNCFTLIWCSVPLRRSLARKRRVTFGWVGARGGRMKSTKQLAAFQPRLQAFKQHILLAEASEIRHCSTIRVTPPRWCSGHLGACANSIHENTWIPETDKVTASLDQYSRPIEWHFSVQCCLVLRYMQCYCGTYQLSHLT